MDNYEELEVKLLDIDMEDIKEKLEKLGVKYKKEVVQKIYTYDCYPHIIMYNLALIEYKDTKSRNSLQKISNICSQIEPIISEEEKEELIKICGYKTIREYIQNNIDNIDNNILSNDYILSLINNSQNRFFKWIRLRQNGDKVEFTVKYIYSSKEEYDIDKVKEIEILVNDFNTANKLIEEIGYYRKKMVEKKRASYVYQNLRIEIDEWPLIEPYLEIEGDSSNEIYEFVTKLGYSKNDAKVINTEDIYLRKGIDLNSFETLTFDKQLKYNM